MSNHNDGATETSPLLADVRENGKSQSKADAARHEDPINDEVGESDGGEIERQSSSDDRAKQYLGLPEVRKNMKYMFPALGIGVYLAAFDQTMIASSAPIIGSELNAVNRTSWIANAYLLTLASFQPLYGKLSNIFSRKTCLLVAYVIFGVGALLCGLARNMNELIAARALAGMGGGGMTTVVSIILSDAIPLKERGTWQGYINIIYASGASTGGAIGGLLADSKIGWRGSFLIQMPVCLAAFIAIFFVLRLPPHEEQHWRMKLKRIDFLGSVMLVLAVAGLLLALDRGSNISWQDKVTLGTLGAALALFAAFLFVELRVASEPLAPSRILFQRSLFSAYICNFFSFAGWLATTFFLPLYFQAVNGLTPTKAGLLLIPAIVSGVSGSLFAGWWMRFTGRFFWLTVAAYTGTTIGIVIILLASGVLGESTVAICAGMMVSGFGNGIGVTSSLISLIANASRDDQATATACSYLFRSLGSTTGVSLSASVTNMTLRKLLERELGSGDEAHRIENLVRKSLDYIQQLEPKLRETVRRCYALSIEAAFALQIALALGAAIAAFGIREKPLSK